MATTTIRVQSQTRDRLNDLARRSGASAGEVVANLVEHADERALLADAVEGWERMAEDPARLAAYRAEVDELDASQSPLPE